MKTIIYTITLMLLSATIFAQVDHGLSKKEQRRMVKEEEKRFFEEKKKAWEKDVEQMIEKNEFVLEADILYDRYGVSQYVNPPMNYILVDSLYGVIQAQSQHYLGRSGLGGEIIEGRITKYSKIKNKKNGSYQIDYTLENPKGAYYVSISISSSGKAEASVRGDFSGSLVRYSGTLVRFEKYKVFKDRTF